MPQTTVSSALTKATPGLLGDAAFNDAVSCIVDLAAGIAPGLGVVRTANGDFAAALPTATFLIAAFLGVSLHSHKAKFSPSNDDNEKYEDEDTMPVLRHGRVWVRSESAFTAGAAAFVRFSAGAGGTQLGAFRTDADTATAVAVAGLRFLTSGSAADLALLEVNLAG
jgi:hypothetical protein